MDEKTLSALKASIKHWEENVAAETPDEASTEEGDCALCRTFQDGWPAGDVCKGCPVQEKTGQFLCNGSPYDDAFRALVKWSRNLGTREDWRKAAQAEVDFLKSLLPDEERENAD